jgi:hypothetical protein
MSITFTYDWFLAIRVVALDHPQCVYATNAIGQAPAMTTVQVIVTSVKIYTPLVIMP